MSVLSYGQIIFYIGIGLAIAGIVAVILSNILFSAKRKKIKKELTDKYGF